jgi:hypothetical protein
MRELTHRACKAAALKINHGREASTKARRKDDEFPRFIAGFLAEQRFSRAK